ncbi:zinc finger protein BRUTUS-like At1g74770 isoform X2 [Macadamia integrifolia]|uniref:zinc finger protein BRUTUS-like At1g74770 isoform X2 n=1 Tax=Macadamia integrifolia TaxID=60698 RepID=UPI001C4ED443|nr:zinc finger protein BRUTUS-like At1g74770 isoform X2 [Macadamia integrifolia]
MLPALDGGAVCMGGGATPATASEDYKEYDKKDNKDEKKKAKEVLLVDTIAGTRVVDAPILFFLHFHKAFRAELTELHRLALYTWETGPPERDLIIDLLRRFHFLMLAFKYHCAAKDEVFPLLVHHLSSKQQASLVWLFVCSIPIIFLEEVLPWMTSYLSLDELEDVMLCFKEVVPGEKLLQEVVASWLGKKNHPIGISAAGRNEKCDSHFHRPLDFSLPKICLSKKILYEETWHIRLSDCLHNDVRNHPLDGLRLWNGAIRKDLIDLLEELHKTRSSKSFSGSSLVNAQLKFLVDVLIFYGVALEKVFFPALNELADGSLSFSQQWFPDEIQIASLVQLLQNFNVEDGPSLSSLVEKLCLTLEPLVVKIFKHLDFQEKEIFSVICKHYNHDEQLWLLYRSLYVMPLGSLKCVITWFSAHLREDELKAVLCTIKLTGPMLDKSFSSLLHEWVRIGYSGKTSVEKFRKQLQEMFKSTCFLPEQAKKAGVSFLDMDAEACKRSYPSLVKPNSANKAKTCASDSSFFNALISEEKCIMLYSSGINLRIFSSGDLNKSKSLSKFPSEKVSADSSLSPEPRPIDCIFFIHKALKKDLEYLVTGSAMVAKDVGFLKEFCRRFHLLRFLYQIHSDAEDEIVFPALEAKEKLRQISHSYRIDHRFEWEHFSNISNILREISELRLALPSTLPNVVDEATLGERMIRYRRLCMELHCMCISINKNIGEHIHREESEIWPLFANFFSYVEQEKIIGCMLGRTRGEVLQEMIPWLMASLTPGERQATLSLWRNATKNTMFNEWLAEWWEDMGKYDIPKVVKESNIFSGTADPLEIIANYLSKEGFNKEKGGACHDEGLTFSMKDFTSCNSEPFKNVGVGKKDVMNETQDSCQFSEGATGFSKANKQRSNKVIDFKHVEKPFQSLWVNQKFRHKEDLILALSQEDMEAVIRRVSHDDQLDSQRKSYILQNLLMSRWIVAQQKSCPEATLSSNGEEIPGQCPSFQDPVNRIFGCKHYKRNCKLFAGCCNQLFTCRYCHDEVSDHLMEGKYTTKMMCMKCLKTQPIDPTCANIPCNRFSMARYFCNICKLFDDEREIYHCPYCNLCRVGKGLGIDYFHCMNCNACMSKSLTVHVCREKCFESNCPICHEYIFTSTSPVKALPCGHLMHSTCFQDYTSTHYTCPICSKSLGDMKVYFGMLDVALAEEKIPAEYSGQTQVILCNDCEKRGITPFHWLYHKCPHCGSFNTRLL